MTADPSAEDSPDKLSDHDRTVHRVARGGTLNLAGTAITAGLILLQSVAVSRGAPTDVAGVFFSVTSAAVIMTTIAVFGAETSLPRFIPVLRAQGRRKAEGGVLRIAGVITLGVSLVMTLALALAPNVMRTIAGAGAVIDEQDRAVISGLFVLCIPLAALSMVWVAATRAYLSMRPTVIVEKVGKSALQLALLAGALAVGASSVGLVSAWLVPTALIGLPAFLWLRAILVRDRAMSDQPSSRAPAAGLLGEYLRFTAPRALQSGLQIALQRLDIIVVAAMLSPSDAAIYALATRFIVLGQFAAGALQQVVAPYFSGLFAKGRSDAASSVARTVTVWTVLLVWPIYLFSMSSGGELLGWLGGAPYAAGASALAVLGAGMLFSSMTGPVDTILLMAGRSLISLFTTAVALVLDLVLLFVLVPRMGIVGAALAWALSMGTKSLLNLIFAWRTAGATSFSKPLFLAIGVSVAAFVLLPAVASYMRPNLTAAVSLAVSATVYAALVGLLRGRLDLSALVALRSRRSVPR